MRDIVIRWKAPVLLLVIASLAGCANASSEGSADKAAAGKADEVVVARFGDEVITLEQADERARASSLKPYQDLYNHRRQAIELILADRLLEKEAAALGTTPEALMQQEVNDKVPPVTDEAVKSFYDQNRGQMGGRELDENLSSQIRQYLTAQGLGQAQADFLERLKAKANVKITLDAPRVDVVLAENDPARGPKDAKVTVVEYSDFQ